MYTHGIDKAVRSQGVFFDTETGGLNRGQQAYSYSYAKYGAATPETYIAKGSHLASAQKNWSGYSKDLYKNTVLPRYDDYKAKGRVVNLGEQLAADMLSFQKNNRLLVGHNIRFDLAVTEELLANHPNLKSLKSFYGAGASYNFSNAALPQGAAKTLWNQKKYSESYKAFSQHITNRLASGQGAVLDTLTTGRYVLAIANEKGLIKTDDFFTGLNMENLSKALGLASQTHDESDVLLNRRVHDWTMSTLGEMENLRPGGKISAQNMGVLNHIVGSQRITSRSKIDMELMEVADYYTKNQAYNYGTRDPITKARVPKGEILATQDIDEFFTENKKFSNYIERYGDVDDSLKGLAPEERLEYFKNTLNQNVKRLQGGEQIDDILRTMREAADGLIPTSKTPYSFRNAETLGESFAKGGTGRKLLMFGAGLFATANLYAYAFSGKDDAYNTIEGLHPGDGVNKDVIQSMTDFGSGWRRHIAKQLQQAGENIAGLKSAYSNAAQKIGVGITSDVNVVASRYMQGFPGNGYSKVANRVKEGAKFEYPISTIYFNKNVFAEHSLNTTGRIPSKETEAIALGHELFEASYLKTTGRTDVKAGSHFSTAVIADEALLARQMGGNYFAEARASRLEELRHLSSSPADEKYARQVRAIYENVDKKWPQIEQKFLSNSRETLHGRGATNIEGLHPGGGVNKSTIQSMTDFGSGYNGQKNSIFTDFNTVDLGHSEKISAMVQQEKIRMSDVPAEDVRSYIAQQYKSTGIDNVPAIRVDELIEKHIAGDIEFGTFKPLLFSEIAMDKGGFDPDDVIKHRIDWRRQQRAADAPQQPAPKPITTQEAVQQQPKIETGNAYSTTEDAIKASAPTKPAPATVAPPPPVEVPKSTVPPVVETPPIAPPQQAASGVDDALKSVKPKDISVKNIAGAADNSISAIKGGSGAAWAIALGGAAAIAAGAYIFSGKDDNYNTIEGLHPGGGVNKSVIQSMTDFGSGYRGPNPQLNASYNEAKDEYGYRNVRASKIGVGEEELYRSMIEEGKEPGEYPAAAASAGTALHEYMQAKRHKEDPHYQSEVLVYNSRLGVSGHIDEIINNDTISDIKTVESWKYWKVKKSRQAYDQHQAQVMLYMGLTGIDKAQIQYVNRENPSQIATIPVRWDPNKYEGLVKKVQRVRSRVESDLANGLVSKSSLPRTASIETLKEYEEDEAESTQEKIRTIDKKRQIFEQEMEYLRQVKRGMPKQGTSAYRRIQESSGFYNTQGIGLQIERDRNKHHIM